MATYNEFSAFIQPREFDNSGRLLANGTIAFYEAGTTTLADVFADSVGTPLANPVQIDGAGTFRVFGEAVAHRVVIKDADGVQIWESDPCFPFGTGTGGTGLGTFAVVLNYAGLRALTTDYDAVAVCGRTTVADGGEGLFFRSPSSVPDNDGTTLVRSGGSRYVRNFSGYIDPRWFGVAYGVASDQMGALLNALAVGPVQIAGLTCINQDRHLPGVLRILSGGFYSTATPKLYLDGRLDDACPGAFGSGIEVVLGRRVAREIRTSWFSSVAQSLCSDYAYAYNVDADANPGINLDIPANYAVDFLGGAKWSFTAGYSVSIANLVYQGAGQILAWDTLDHVAAVDLGGAVSRLEWFGGAPGGAFGIDNRIAMKAALLSGRLDVPEYYRVIDSGVAWSSGKAFHVTGTGTLDIDNDFACTSMTAEGLTITGGASITVAGVLELTSGATMANLVEYASSGTEATGSVAVPNVYYAVGTGIAIRATDPTTWSTMTGPTGVLRGVWAAGRIMVAGSSGQIWKSTDGSSWTSQTLGSGQWNKIKFLNGRWILVGAGGLAYWSLDGDTWNPITTGTTKDLNDLEWSAASGYVFIGATATVRTSPDLITWTARTLPGSPIGDANAITIAASGRLFLSGGFGGMIFYSDDGATWSQTVLAISDAIYCGASSPEVTIFASSSGRIWKTLDNGATWTYTSVGGASFLSVSYKEGDWIFGDADGLIYHSFDLSTFTPNDTGFPVPIWGVYTIPPLYAVVGLTNSARRSTNGVDWENVTVGISAGNLRNVRQFFGSMVVVGDGGRVYFSNDFRTFTRAVTDVSNDIYDVAYHGGKYVIVGSSGLVMHTPDIFKAAPTWTTETPLTSDTLIRAASDTTNLVICSASKTLTGTAVTGLTLTSTIGGGIIRFGTLWIRYGASGAVYTSTDKIAWTKRISNTTTNLAYATATPTTVVIASGTEIIRSNDGITWTASAPVGTLTAIAYNSVRGELGYTNTVGGFYTSINNGASWTLSHTAGAGLYGLFAYDGPTGEWNILGAGGLWKWSANLSTWANPSTSYSGTLRCGFGSTDFSSAIVFGDGGLVLRRDANSTPEVSDLSSKLVIPGDIIAAAQDGTRGTVLTSAGVTYKTDARGSFAATSGVSSANVTSLFHDTLGKKLYATGTDTWVSDDSNGNFRWDRDVLTFAGVTDMQYRDGKFWAVGANGFYVSSTNGNVWKNQAAIGSTTANYSVDLTRAGLSADLAWARTMAIGSRSVIAGTSGRIDSGAGASTPVVVANRLDATDATATVNITTEVPGSILRSSLRNVTTIGQTFDSSFSRFSGVMHGNVARTSIAFGGTATVAAPIIIAEASLAKTDAVDPTKVPMFAIASQRLQIDLCTVEPNGALCYSTDTATVVLLNDCQNSGNFSFPLSNGYAKVYLNRCGSAVRNASAYSIDGVTMETVNALPLVASETLTSSTATWKGLPAGSTSDGTTITLGAAMPLSPSLADTATLRYYGTNAAAVSAALDAILNLGGRIRLTVEYPNGYTPDARSKPVATLVRQRMEYTNTISVGFTWGGPLNQSLPIGVSSPAGIAVTAGKAVAVSNAWGGAQEVLIPQEIVTGSAATYKGIEDQWGDGYWRNNGSNAPTAGSDSIISSGTYAYPRSARVVIYNAGTGELPAGTKIKVEAIPEVPRNSSQFASFFNGPDTTVDIYQKVERQSFIFRDGQNGTLQVTRALNATSAIQTEKQYLSFGTGGTTPTLYTQNALTTLHPSPSGGGVFPLTFIHPTDKSKIFPTVASSSARVEILLPGLDSSDLTTGTYYSRIDGGPPTINYGDISNRFIRPSEYDPARVWWYHRLDRHVIEDGVWELVARPVLKHPEGVVL